MIILVYKPLLIDCTTNFEQQTGITFRDHEKCNTTWRRDDGNVSSPRKGAGAL